MSNHGSGHGSGHSSGIPPTQRLFAAVLSPAGAVAARRGRRRTPCGAGPAPRAAGRGGLRWTRPERERWEAGELSLVRSGPPVSGVPGERPRYETVRAWALGR
ncbi:hypothetical protein ACH4TY_07490 [Streptomyces anulatus]